MASTASTMQALGFEAPAFTLPNTHLIAGEPMVSLSDYADSKAVLIAFICNHCPYVIHLRDAFNAFAEEYLPLGLTTIAISANDATTHPDDAPEQMAEEAAQHSFGFPYLYDEEQSVAKAYRAACTPDFFLFDECRRLTYRGQFDASRPKNNEPVTGSNLRKAADAVLAGNTVSGEQGPSIGCNIKWKSGREPDYFPA